MPTKKRRIGFIPRFDVLKVVNKISEEEKLSNSKVVNILIEDALYMLESQWLKTKKELIEAL